MNDFDRFDPAAWIDRVAVRSPSKRTSSKAPPLRSKSWDVAWLVTAGCVALSTIVPASTVRAAWADPVLATQESLDPPDLDTSNPHDLVDPGYWRSVREYIDAAPQLPAEDLSVEIPDCFE